MKLAVLHGPKDFRVENVSDPKLEPDNAIIQVKAFGICGSETPIFERGLPSERVEKRGLEALSASMLGHEWSGEVVEVGANVTNVKPGDRITMGGYAGFSEYRSIPARGLIPLPDDMSYEIAATVEPVGIGVGAATKAEPGLGDTAVVLGAGMIGQGTWQVLKVMGVSQVIVTEVAKKRLEVARALGADIVINAAEEDPVERIYQATSGMGADIVIDCAGSTTTFHQAFEIARGGGVYQYQFRDWGDKDGRAIAAAAGIDPRSRGGKVVIVTSPPQVEWQPRVIYVKSLSLIGNIGGNMRQAFDLMVAGRINTKPCITHQFPLDKINEAFETQLKRDEAIKVIVKP